MLSLRVTHAALFINIFNSCTIQQQSLSLHYLDIAEQLIHEILTTNQQDAGCDELWHHVAQHLHHPWSNANLAAWLNLSLSSFQRLMRNYYGQSARQRLIELRMNKASLLLRQTDYSLDIIAEHIGYSTAFIFSNAFKKWSGKSPKEWRLKNTN